MKDKLNIRFVGNSPVLGQKVREYLNSHGLTMTHYNQANGAECDYLIVIDPTEEAIKRMRVQELWKTELQEKHTQAKMIVLDWWACRCNGFVSPMGIPKQIERFLDIAQPVNEVSNCKYCHAQTRAGIRHIFKSHDEQAPLFGIQNELASLIDYLNRGNKMAASKALEELRSRALIYQKDLDERINIIAVETPFINDFYRIKEYLNRLIAEIAQDIKLMNIQSIENMDGEASLLIEYINSVGKKAQIL